MWLLVGRRFRSYIRRLPCSPAARQEPTSEVVTEYDLVGYQRHRRAIPPRSLAQDVRSASVITSTCIRYEARDRSCPFKQTIPSASNWRRFWVSIFLEAPGTNPSELTESHRTRPQEQLGFCILGVSEVLLHPKTLDHCPP